MFLGRFDNADPEACQVPNRIRTRVGGLGAGFCSGEAAPKLVSVPTPQLCACLLVNRLPCTNKSAPGSASISTSTQREGECADICASCHGHCCVLEECAWACVFNLHRYSQCLLFTAGNLFVALSTTQYPPYDSPAAYAAFGNKITSKSKYLALCLLMRRRVRLLILQCSGFAPFHA